MPALAALVLAALVLAGGCAGDSSGARQDGSPGGGEDVPMTFAAAGTAALSTLERTLYAGGGAWLNLQAAAVLPVF